MVLEYGVDKIIELARKQGVIRPRDLTRLGMSVARLRGLVVNGTLTKTGRGLYTLSDFDVTEFHSLVEAGRAQSKAVICLLTALNFHGLGTQIPRQVWVAVPYGTRISATSVPMR